MLVRMAGEMEAVFHRLLAFRLTFPHSNITSMLATRQALLRPCRYTSQQQLHSVSRS